MITRDITAKRLRGLQWNAVTRVNISHLSFADDDEWFLMNAVLPWVQSKVNAATQKPRLKTSFAIARDDLAFFKRTFAAPDFFNHTNLRVRDINDPEQSRQTKQRMISAIVQAIVYQEGFAKSARSSRRFRALFLSEVVSSSELFLVLNA
jgi:hypothetical protein